MGKLFRASSLSNRARSSSTSSAKSTSSVRLFWTSSVQDSSLIFAVFVAIFKMSMRELLLLTLAETVVNLCRVRYDSKACRFKAAAAAEFAGNSAACCSEFIMAFCKDKATFCMDLCKKFSCSIAVAKFRLFEIVSCDLGDMSCLFSTLLLLRTFSEDVCILMRSHMNVS